MNAVLEDEKQSQSSWCNGYPEEGTSLATGGDRIGMRWVMLKGCVSLFPLLPGLPVSSVSGGAASFPPALRSLGTCALTALAPSPPNPGLTCPPTFWCGHLGPISPFTLTIIRKSVCDLRPDRESRADRITRRGPMLEWG